MQERILEKICVETELELKNIEKRFQTIYNLVKGKNENTSI